MSLVCLTLMKHIEDLIMFHQYNIFHMMFYNLIFVNV